MESRDFFDLPHDVVMNVFSFLDAKPLVQATSTCHSYHSSPSTAPLWHSLYTKNISHKPNKVAKRGIFSFEGWKPGYHNFLPKCKTTTPKKMFMLKKETADFNPYEKPICIDFGSYTCKAGIGGEGLPACLIPPICVQGKQGTYIYGDQCQKGNLQSDPIRPIVNREIANFDKFVELWEYTNVDCMKVLPPETVTLLQHNLWDAKIQRKLTEIAFEEFGVFALYIAPNSCFSTFAVGCQCAVSIDVGYESLSIILINDGLIVADPAPLVLPIGGNHVTMRLKQLAQQRYHNILEELTDNDFEDMKKQLCYVVPDPAKTTCDIEEKTYKGFLFDKELHESAELIFDPTLVGCGTRKLANIIVDFINASTLPKADFLKNIVVCGGGSMLPGFGERLKSEIKLFCEEPFRVKDEASYKYLDETRADTLAWLGGSIEASITHCFSHFWVTREEYAEKGADVVQFFTGKEIPHHTFT